MRRWLLFLLSLATCAAVGAQQSRAHVAFVYPAGGMQGTSFDVTVGGEFLDGAVSAFFSGEGVSATVVHFEKPLPQMERDNLSKALKEFERNHTNNPIPAKPASTNASANNNSGKLLDTPRTLLPWTPEDRQVAAEMRKQLDLDMRLRSTPALSHAVTLHVTIAPYTTLGNHELRLVTNRGLTNPVVFLVDHLPETSLARQFVPSKVAAGGGTSLSPQAHADRSPPPQMISLPIVVNGQVMPGTSNSYCFRVRKGQKIVIVALTRTLIPYMADAVPGWFQAALTLSDANGKEIAFADHFRFSQEPVIETDIPADGNYLLSVRDILNRGREDFVYRITIGEIPYVTGIFPIGGRSEEKMRIGLSGWNLPSNQLKFELHRPGVYRFAAGKLTTDNDGWPQNPVLFRATTQHEFVETNPAINARHARRITLPVVISGRIARPGTAHYFRLNADAGQQIVAEVEARRLGSPLDSTLTLFDAKGHQLAFNDDSDEKDAPLLTHQADSRIEYRFASKGSYLLRIADNQQNGGPDYACRLRVGPSQPDFQVRFAPSSINLRPGRSTPVHVMLLRRDGFQGAVKLHIKDAPEGLFLSGAEISVGVDTLTITLTAPPAALATPHRLLIKAEAMIDGKVRRHDAEPVDDDMQAFAWHEPVPAREGQVWILGKEHRKPLWPAFSNRLIIPKGGSAVLQIPIPKGMTSNHFNLKLDESPSGISISEIKQNDSVILVRVTSVSSVKPGLAGNLIAEMSIVKTGSSIQRPSDAKFELLPAIPFAVVPPQ